MNEPQTIVIVGGGHNGLAAAAYLALAGLRAVVKDMVDIAGERAGGGNPDWLAQAQTATANAAPVERIFPPAGSKLRGMLKAMRPYQWVKNLLVLVPLAAILGSSIAGGVDLSTMMTLTAWFMGLYMGGHTLKDLAVKWTARS